jgi:hypothetical protein
MSAAGDCIDDAFDLVKRQKLRASSSRFLAFLAGAITVLDSSNSQLNSREDSERFRYRTMKVRKALEVSLYSEFVRMMDLQIEEGLGVQEAQGSLDGRGLEGRTLSRMRFDV